jgi:hypothetical protein
MTIPAGYTERDGKVFNGRGEWVEFVDGKWLIVRDASRGGWWRHHEHYDRNGYCDNPGRGY